MADITTSHQGRDPDERSPERPGTEASDSSSQPANVDLEALTDQVYRLFRDELRLDIARRGSMSIGGIRR